MEIIRKTIKRTTLVIEADKISKYYLSESGDIVIIDEDYILHQLHLLAVAKKTGVFVLYFTSITENKRQSILNKDNLWINKNAPRVNAGSIITMLQNKGY